MTMREITMLVAGAALAAALAATPARAADELSEISALSQQGNHARALERVETYLAANPRDTRARFLKGVILTGLGKNTEAIRTFSMLTKDFPELPEPYNNLAVLYALEGDYDRARTTLEAAIRKNPGYAIAYENLGDLHAKLASQAYEQARKLDKANNTAQPKIDTLRGMLKGAPAAPRVAAAEPAAPARPPVVAPPPPAAQAAAPPPPAPAKSAPAAAPAAPPPVKAAPPAPVAAAPAPPAAAPAKAAPTPEPAKAPAAAEPKPAVSPAAGEVLAALEGWARAWSGKDAAAYLAFYAPGFKVPGGASRAQWEGLRRALIDKPKKIEVSVNAPKVTLSGDNRATVSFRQHYRSDSRDDQDNKTMVFVRNDGKWQIVEERVEK